MKIIYLKIVSDVLPNRLSKLKAISVKVISEESIGEQ